MTKSKQSPTRVFGEEIKKDCDVVNIIKKDSERTRINNDIRAITYQCIQKKDNKDSHITVVYERVLNKEECKRANTYPCICRTNR
jgi:hypothetical protein